MNIPQRKCTCCRRPRYLGEFYNDADPWCIYCRRGSRRYYDKMRRINAAAIAKSPPPQSPAPAAR